MDYRQFSAVELATDSSFINWVQRPDEINTAFWEGFLTLNTDRAEVVAAARYLVTGWHIDHPAPSAGSRGEVWTKIQAGIATDKPTRPTIRLGWFGGEHSQFMRYAAVFLGLFLLTAAYRWGIKASPTHYATGKGETRIVTLPDNSTVVLAANSSVAVVGNWTSGHPRELALQGEAFFSVTHQQNSQPFVVKTPGNLRVEVLGTRFTITERATATQVVLNSGRVALYPNRDTHPLFMKPGDLVEVPKTQQPRVIRRSVQPEVYSAWTNNQFIFENTSLGEIAAIIESEFSCKVQFTSDSLKDRRVTLRLPNRDLSLLLTSLAEIHDLKIDRQANRILITQSAVAP